MFRKLVYGMGSRVSCIYNWVNGKYRNSIFLRFRLKFAPFKVLKRVKLRPSKIIVCLLTLILSNHVRYFNEDFIFIFSSISFDLFLENGIVSPVLRRI